MGRSAPYQDRGGHAKQLPRDEAKGWGLNKWVNFFHRVYGKVDKDVPPSILWLNAVDEATKLSEWVRRDKPTEAVRRIVRLFAWTCSFVGKYLKQQKFDASDPIKSLLRDNKLGSGFHPQFLEIEESYLKWILWKYPTACTVCGSRPCECGVRRALVEARKATAQYDKEFVKHQIEWADRLREKKEALDDKKFRQYRKKSLDQLIDEFIYIYGGGHEDLDLWCITAHLFEEVGEVARDILALEELSEEKLKGMNEKELIQALESSWSHYVEMKLKENAPSDEEAGRRFTRILRGGVIQPDDGLPQALLERLDEQIKGAPFEAAALLRDWAVEDLKGELADTFSWISAFLHKIGEGWRAYRSTIEEKDKTWYQFAAFLVADCADRAGNLGCPRCKQPKCSKGCLLSGSSHTILHEKGETELREALGRSHINNKQS